MSIPRYAFVSAVALWQLNYRKDAITVLAEAHTRWPGNYDILVTWAKYAYQLRDVTALKTAVKALGEYYPNDATYKQLLGLLN